MENAAPSFRDHLYQIEIVAPTKTVLSKAAMAQQASKLKEVLTRLWNKAKTPQCVRATLRGHGSSFIAVRNVPLQSFDGNKAIRVVNIEVHDCSMGLPLLDLAREVAGDTKAQVRINLNGSYLSAFGKDLLVTADANTAQILRTWQDSGLYVKEHGSLLNGPQAKKHRANIDANEKNRKKHWSSPKAANAY